MSTKTERLTCCCCGSATRGRQWPNRDTGYGICRKCVEWLRSDGMSDEEVIDLYGHDGLHWGVTSEELTEALGEALSK